VGPVQMALAIMAADDVLWGPRDAHSQRRARNAEEFDPFAGFHWHWPDLKRPLIACADAGRSIWWPALPRLTARPDRTDTGL
jgi:hypothetical protein